MIESYLTLDSVEIVNHTRLQAYITNGLVTGYDHLEACACPTLSAASFGDAPYVSPAADPAPWYDAADPDSADFAGLLVLSMTGMDDRPTSRSVSQAVTGGGVFGRQTVTPRTMVVQGVLLGTSCCGVAYGLRWLGRALGGCGTPGCDGDTMGVLSCCPPEEMSAAELQAAYGRTIRRVALTSGPTVTRRAGGGCAGGCTADVLFVEFILQAAEPWQWGAAEEVASMSLPTDDGESCIEWSLVETGCPWDSDCCHNASCATHAGCNDPACQTAAPPAVPLPVTCACLPLATNTSCVEIDTAAFGSFSEVLPILTVDAGSSDLRRLIVSIYERDPADVGSDCCDATPQDIDYDEATVDYDDPDVFYDGEVPSIDTLERCEAVATFHVGYLASGEAMVLDGQVRRALIDCEGVQTAASDVWGSGGSPLSFPPLGCAKTYCVVVATDALFTPSTDATLTIELTGRE